MHSITSVQKDTQHTKLIDGVPPEKSRATTKPVWLPRKSKENTLLNRACMQNELLFKRLKPNLRSKDFLWTSFNVDKSWGWCTTGAVLLLEEMGGKSTTAEFFGVLAVG